MRPCSNFVGAVACSAIAQKLVQAVAVAVAVAVSAAVCLTTAQELARLVAVVESDSKNC